jgi:hypothetical protein
MEIEIFQVGKYDTKTAIQSFNYSCNLMLLPIWKSENIEIKKV